MIIDFKSNLISRRRLEMDELILKILFHIKWKMSLKRMQFKYMIHFKNIDTLIIA